jgi:hypothetical protein
MEYYLAIFLGGILLSFLGIIFQRTIQQPINGKGLMRDFLVGLGVTAGIFYSYPDALKQLSIPIGSSDSSDLLLQVG